MPGFVRVETRRANEVETASQGSDAPLSGVDGNIILIDTVRLVSPYGSNAAPPAIAFGKPADPPEQTRLWQM